MKTIPNPLLLVTLAFSLGCASSAWADAPSKPATAPQPAPVTPAAPADSAATAPQSQSQVPTATPSPTESGALDEAVALAPVVIESPATLTPGAVSTPKGAGAEAREKHFKGELNRGLNTHTLPLVGKTPEQRALETEREEKRAAAIEDTKRMVVLAKTDGSPDADALKNELNEISVRKDLIEDTTPSTLRRD